MAAIGTSQKSYITSRKIINNLSWNIHHFPPIAIYQYTMNNDIIKPSLVFLLEPGKSIDNTIDVICSRLQYLTNKYHTVLIINLCHDNDIIHANQIHAIKIQDETKTEDMTLYYKHEIELYNKISIIVNYILSQQLKLTSVHLFGTRKSSWIAINTITKNIIYKGLYMASPYVPFYLQDISKEQTYNMEFHFGWSAGDVSIYDKDIYDNYMSQNKHKYYKSQVYDIIEGFDLHPDMIYDICK